LPGRPLKKPREQAADAQQLTAAREAREHLIDRSPTAQVQQRARGQGAALGKRGGMHHDLVRKGGHDGLRWLSEIVGCYLTPCKTMYQTSHPGALWVPMGGARLLDRALGSLGNAKAVAE
jgi:hypothetical protein